MVAVDVDGEAEAATRKGRRVRWEEIMVDGEGVVMMTADAGVRETCSSDVVMVVGAVMVHLRVGRAEEMV